MADLLDVRLGEIIVGKLTLLTGDRTFFAFEETYLSDANRPILSQSFFTQTGDLIPETRTIQTRLPPFFSNLLPEGHLRNYLAAKGGIKPSREFKLIELLGEDLPGAVIIKSVIGASALQEKDVETQKSLEEAPYRFSLAGVQLKFSALAESTGGLTIPANGIGGDWIIKLPSQNFAYVPENEWSMLHLARNVGIPVPENKLIDIGEIKGLPDLGVLAGTKALAVKRFDRSTFGKRIHIEDFAQVYGVFPDDKYGKVSYTNIANMVWTLTGEKGLIDFVKRLVVTIFIGNGDMHLKNWSFLYPDGKTPELAPAYDFVSTIPYIPDDKLALNLSGAKEMAAIDITHFQKLATKAFVPEFLTVKTVKETIEALREVWGEKQKDYPLPKEILIRINQHIKRLKLV
jgi:serine/threonine-protein kinase HipA